MSAEVSAVVLAYDDDEAVQRCLRALAGAGAELVVVLNRVSEPLREELRAGPAIVVEPAGNLGFAGGIAAALEQATGEWVALVNQDCVVQPGTIAELLAVGRSGSDVGSVAAQVRFARLPDSINSAGLEVDQLGVAWERLLGCPVASGPDEVAEVFGASATLALYRRAMLDQIGGFDPTFFAYLEDADVAWRARMAGWRCLYAPAAVGLHEHSTVLGHGSAAKHFLVGRNRVRLIAKNATGAHLRRRAAAMVAYDLAYVAYAAVRNGTLAPLRGRVYGLREWRAYRTAGRAQRAPVALVPAGGVREALRRNRAYGSFSG